MVDTAPEPQSSEFRRLAGLAVLGAAVIAALSVTLFFLLSSDDDGTIAGSGDDLITPITEVPGAPTPVAGSGVLDSNRPEVGETAPNFALPDAREPGCEPAGGADAGDRDLDAR